MEPLKHKCQGGGQGWGVQQEIKEGKKSEEERVREKNRSRGGGRVCWDVFKELFNLNRSAFH